MTIIWQWNGSDLSQILTASSFPVGVGISPSGSVSASLQTGDYNTLGRPFVRFQCAGLKTNTLAGVESMWVIPLNVESLPKRYFMKISVSNMLKISGANTNFRPYVLHCTRSLASASFSGRGFGNYLEDDINSRQMICITGTCSSSAIPGGGGLVGAGSPNVINSPQSTLEIQYHTGETPFARAHSPFWIRHSAKNTEFADSKKRTGLLYFTGVYSNSLNGLQWDGLALGFQSQLSLTPQFDVNSYIDIDAITIYKHPLDE